MKKYISMFIIVSTLYAMEDERIQIDPTSIIEKKLTKKFSKWFIEKYQVNLENKALLLYDGGESLLSSKTIARAATVCILAKNSKKLTKSLETYCTLQNMHGVAAPLPQFKTANPYDLAIGFDMLGLLILKNNISTQKACLTQLNNALLMNSEAYDVHFFGIPQIHANTLQELCPSIPLIGSFINNIITNSVSSFKTEIEENETILNNLVQQTGFKILSKKEKTIKATLHSQFELIDVLSDMTPGIDYMPNWIRLWFLDKYMTLLIPQLKQNEKKHYIMPLVTVQIIHMKKVQEAYETENL